jgi:hypothetical protein
MGRLHVSDQTWKQAYAEALFEMEPELLQSKVQAAQMAIENRLLELRSGRSITRPREVHELTDAQRLLQRLGEN